MAQTKVRSSGLNPNISTDANGWTVIDYGNHKAYKKSGTTSFTLASLAWNNSTSCGNLPTAFSGVIPSSNCFVEGAAGCGDAAITVSIYALAGNSTVIFPVSNQFNSSISSSVTWSLTFVVLS